MAMNPPPDEEGRQGIGDLSKRFKTAAGLLKTPTAPHTAVTAVISDASVTQRHLPLRYQWKEDEVGSYLMCVEASNIRVRIKRGLSVSASSARKSPKGTIYLDGAAQGEPFMDGSRGVYNLDHHEGCVRAFTLASCEQAMVVILKGLDLAGERWTVHANEPDFDTVLAIWLLLNHRRLSDDGSDLRRRIMPMVRLQGAIDAHGLELAGITGYSDELQRATFGLINALRAREIELKKEGEWNDVDFLEYTASVLQQIDEEFYSAADFKDLHEIEETARVWIGPQRFALACRSDAGIYEVEEQLKESHGDRLGLLLLEKDGTTYTLRQTDPFLSTTLESVYERLNLLDRAAKGDNKWGGSDDIGGSPRATGTALSLNEIVGICRWVYQPPSVGRRLASVAVALAASSAVVVLAVLAGGFAGFGAFAERGPGAYSIGTLVLLGLALALAVLGKARFPGHFGLGRVRNWGPVALLPVAALAAVAGGAWIPLQGALGAEAFRITGWWYAVALLAGVVGIEVLMRGVVHGTLVTAYPIMLWSGRRFLSIPNLVSAAAYMLAVTACFAPPTWLGIAGTNTLAWMVSSFVLGLVCGAVRERSGSVWGAALVHAAAAALAWVVVPLLIST